MPNTPLKIENIEIVKRTRQSNQVITGLLSLLLLVAFVLDFRTAVLSVASVGSVWVLGRLVSYRLPIYIAIVLGLGGMYLLSELFDMTYPLYVFVSALAAVVLSSIYAITKEGKLEPAVIFYMDDRVIKCLSTGDNDYKAYTHNPLGFYKTFEMSRIQGITIRRKFMEINYQGTVIRPRELKAEDLGRIEQHIQQHFPNLLNPLLMEEAYHEEKISYNVKFGFLAFGLLIAVIIYFFADNGRNTKLTYMILAAGIVILGIIMSIVSIAKRRHEK